MISPTTPVILENILHIPNAVNLVNPASVSATPNGGTVVDVANGTNVVSHFRKCDGIMTKKVADIVSSYKQTIGQVSIFKKNFFLVTDDEIN
jgi:hypothetical protein